MGKTNVTNKSLWVNTTPIPTREVLNKDIQTEVLIIGAGITGVTLAFLLSKKYDVTLIEAGEICAGVTGFTTAKISCLQGTIYSDLIEKYDANTAKLYADANVDALNFIRETVSTNNIECDLTDASAITFTQNKKLVKSIYSEVSAAQEVGLQTTFSNREKLPFEIAGAVVLDNQAHFNPRAYIKALCEICEANGVKIFEKTRAKSISSNADYVETTTDDVRIKSEYVVQATHIPISDKHYLSTRMIPHRSYAIAIKPDQQLIDQGMYINIEDETRSWRHIQNGSLIVGGQGHRTGEQGDSNPYETLIDWARENFGPFELQAKWSTQDYITPDRLPYIGREKSDDHKVYLATGFSKWGMTSGTFAAQILADKIMGFDNEYEEVFDSTRVNLPKSSGGLIEQTLKTAKHYIVDKAKPAISNKKLEDIPRDSGMLVTLNGETVAAYKNTEGLPTCLSAKCTHMGCEVLFNHLEKSWDCPCHGSRFDIDGTVLNGPAVDDLERK